MRRYPLVLLVVTAALGACSTLAAGVSGSFDVQTIPPPVIANPAPFQPGPTVQEV